MQDGKGAQVSRFVSLGKEITPATAEMRWTRECSGKAAEEDRQRAASGPKKIPGTKLMLQARGRKKGRAVDLGLL